MTAIAICAALAIIVVACTVTVINVDTAPQQRCDQEMSIEVFGGVVLHACENELDRDGKLTP
jgi:hypothetical protein